MLPRYDDILELTDSCGMDPDWFDEHGVPRFRPFHPTMLGVYDCFAVLATIRCADRHCQKPMLVGVGWPKINMLAVLTGRQDRAFNNLESLATGFDFGDPPRHDCTGAGETMRSDVVEILQAWERPDTLWQRRADLEGPVPDTDEQEQGTNDA